MVLPALLLAAIGIILISLALLGRGPSQPRNDGGARGPGKPNLGGGFARIPAHHGLPLQESSGSSSSSTVEEPTSRVYILERVDRTQEGVGWRERTLAP